MTSPLSRFGSAATLIGTLLVLAACSSTQDKDDPLNYKSAQGRAPLDIPPNLVSPGADGRFIVPGSSKKTLSEYRRQQKVRNASSLALLPKVDGVTMERDGRLRWLQIGLPPEQVWAVMREFWIESGFLLDIDSPQTGVLETDWAENRAKIPDDFFRNLLGKVLDSFYSTGERDRFRVRLEPIDGGTELYLSHRGLEEVFVDKQDEQTRWQARPNDPGLEIEFMRRLMLRFGVDEQSSQVAVKAATNKRRALATISQQQDQSVLNIAERFDRAWRHLGLALDRTGFTVEDRDRSKGTYFVRYIDPEHREADDPGAIARFFGAKAVDKKLQQYQIIVVGAQDVANVSVKSADGETLQGKNSATADRMLKLLAGQLNRQ